MTCTQAYSDDDITLAIIAHLDVMVWRYPVGGGTVQLEATVTPTTTTGHCSRLVGTVGLLLAYINDDRSVRIAIVVGVTHVRVRRMRTGHRSNPVLPVVGRAATLRGDGETPPGLRREALHKAEGDEAGKTREDETRPGPTPAGGTSDDSSPKQQIGHHKNLMSPAGLGAA